ncbi:MAG: nitroreductase family protein [Candidatus Cloacimonetes bacterium]|nr:nitroreductase family protein [Candidatus Cloacimonadota bacterium]
MQFLKLAKKRYSARAFTDKPVSRKDLEQVLEAARIAPSAKNLQPLHLIVFTEPEMRKKVFSAYPRRWIDQAQAVVVCCVDRSICWRRPDGKSYGDIDAAIAIDHMTLAAAELGLGTCWVGLFNAYELSLILELPSHIDVVALLPIGWPAKHAASSRHNERKSLDQMVHWGGFSS